jgi:hypothetical protein
MKALITVFAMVLLAGSVQAADSVTNCTGHSKDQEKVDVQIASGTMKVSVGVKQVLSTTQVRNDLAGATAAQDSTNKADAMITWTEHEEALDDGSFEGLISLAIDGKDKLSDIEISCKK